MTPSDPDWWRAYVGAPYRWRGEDLVSGFDCWGLVLHAFENVFGRSIDDFGWRDGLDADDINARAAFIEGELPDWREVEWEEGAVALFNIAGEPLHVGLALGREGTVLHAYRIGGVDLLDLTQLNKWKRRLAGLYLPA